MAKTKSKCTKKQKGGGGGPPRSRRIRRRRRCQKPQRSRYQKLMGFTKAIGRIRKQVLTKNPNTLGDAIKIALKSA